jgi:signal transduction histidine kinase
MRRPHSGLRLRLIASLVLCSAITLAAAVITLLPPLEHRLRADQLKLLKAGAATVLPTLEELPPPQLKPGSAELARIARSLSRQTGARVAIVDRNGRRFADTDPDITAPLPEGPRAIQSGRAQASVSTVTGAGEAQVAVPVAGEPLAVVLRKPLGDVRSAVRSVRHAVVVAALVAVGTALLLGLAFATGLLRRLERLRQAALRLARGGFDEPLPDDGSDSRDEVGDLARAFAVMQAQLRRQEDARRSFVATASHELRTPLAALGGMLELLGADLDDGRLDAAREELERAQGQTARLTGLARDLLELSRIDAGVALRSEPVEFAAIVRAVLAEFDSRRAELGLQVELRGADEHCLAQADPGGVAQIVRILVDNALRFAPVGTSIRVEIDCREGMPTLTVADLGPGVPVDERELIFERFKRGAETAGGGFGLGLAIGRELAERMGGSLTLEDDPVGACFVLRMLPAATPSEPASMVG